MSKYKVVLRLFPTLVMAPNKCKLLFKVLAGSATLEQESPEVYLGQYQLLHPPGLLHLPSNGQWGALLHRCMLETQPEVAVARDGLEYAL